MLKEKIREIREENLKILDKIVKENIKMLKENEFHVIEVKDIKDVEKVADIFDSPVAKAKSNTVEEISLKEILRKRGIEVYETDCGEFIVDALKIKSRNPIRPSAHVSLETLRKFFGKDSIEEIKDEIKRIVEKNIEKAKIALFGANAVAEGSIFLLENEGNMARLFSKKKAVFIAGWEKFLKSFEEAILLCKSQAYFGVGYEKPAFIHIISGPSCTGDILGKKIRGMYGFEELYFILIDRSKIYNSDFRELLKCINCGRCSLFCPVLKVSDFGNPGPKSLYFEFFWNKVRVFPEIFKCSLCKRCEEECPVGIKHSEIIRKIRKALWEEGISTEKNKRMVKNMLKFGNPVGEVKESESFEIFCC